MHGNAAVGCVLALVLLAQPAGAQMDWSEPEIPPAPADAATRDAIRAEVEARAAAERARAAIEQPAVWKFCGSVFTHPGIPT